MTSVDGKPLTHYFTGPLICQYDQQLILHTFSVVPVSYASPWEGPSELPWGHTPVRSPQGAPYFNSMTDKPEEQDSIPSHILQAVDPSAWDKGIPGRP